MLSPTTPLASAPLMSCDDVGTDRDGITRIHYMDY
jgi:hypothetical protein